MRKSYLSQQSTEAHFVRAPSNVSAIPMHLEPSSGNVWARTSQKSHNYRVWWKRLGGLVCPSYHSAVCHLSQELAVGFFHVEHPACNSVCTTLAEYRDLHSLIVDRRRMEHVFGAAGLGLGAIRQLGCVTHLVCFGYHLLGGSCGLHNQPTEL